MDDISKLSNAELSKQLKSHDLPSGPITKTTRPLFERKLRKHLAGPDSASETTESKEGDQKHGSEHVGDGNHGNTNDDTEVRSGVADPQRETGKEVIGGNETAKQFYSIQLPKGAQGAGMVLTDRHAALQQLKKLSGSRLKVFTSREDAVGFSENPETGSTTPCPRPTGSADVKVSAPMPSVVPAKLKRAIEAGDLDTVRSLVWSNPRYLIGSGDTPVIIQFGCHYNALHVAAMKNQPAICRLILETLEDVGYVKMLYPDESPVTDQQCIDFVVDLYLNTPDKGNCETPLHFACKFGHVDVVDFLASHPKTDKTVVNRDGNTPKEVICERVQQATATIKGKIAQSLEDHYFVPLLRAEDDSNPPQVGVPWTPNRTHHKSVATAPSSPMQSPIRVKAYAGPMGSDKAKEFHKWWRYRKSAGRSTSECRQFLEIKRSDYEKGLERIGRVMAHDMGISWNEYWDFLDCFADLSTTDGLHKLEAYLQQLHESESVLASQDDALLQMEQKMECLGLGHSPDGTPLHGTRDPCQVLRCWGTPPGMYSRDGESESGEVESETKVLVVNGGEAIKGESILLTDGEVESESTVLTEGGKDSDSETKVWGDGGGEHKSESIVSADESVNSETTLSVHDGDVKNESNVLGDDGKDIESETRSSVHGNRDIETHVSLSSNECTCQPCGIQKDKPEADVFVHDKDQCQVSPEVSDSVESSDTELSHVDTDTTVKVKTSDVPAVKTSDVSEQVITCLTHHVRNCASCRQQSTDDSTVGEQNAAVIIGGDEESKTHTVNGWKLDSTNVTSCAVTKETIDSNQQKPHPVKDGDVHHISSSCANEHLSETVASTCVSHLCQNTTRAHDRGDGYNNEVLCKCDGIRFVDAIDGGDACILPCIEKPDDALKGKLGTLSSISNSATKETVIRTNVGIACVVSSTCKISSKKEEILSEACDKERFYKNTTVPKDCSSGSDDACSVCSSVSSYHTARDHVDFDYASLDDVFVPSRSQSPSRMPPVFILGSTPSKKDLDVLRALENAPVSPDDHPHVTQWRQLVLSYSEEARKTWSTPMRQRKLLDSHLTPTPGITPLGVNSPGYIDNVTTSGSSDSSQSDADEFSQHRDMRNVRANLLSSFTSL